MGTTRMLGDFQLGGELGRGATGVVYEGTDSRTGRMVAVKTLALSRSFHADDLAEARIRFFHEAGAAQRLSHPNIITVYAAGEDRDVAYVAMERLKGRDLASYVGRGDRVPLALLLSICARVADALAYAHGHGVVHSDIKPANIVWERESDSVKITDFGMAQISDFLTHDASLFHGTPSYMSPERLAGDRIDGRSDLFSLGVSLYQLACGELPFRAESIGQLQFRVIREQHADIRLHDPAVPACIVAVIDRALEKDPGRRFQDGGQMAEALRSCLKALKIPAGPERGCAVLAG